MLAQPGKHMIHVLLQQSCQIKLCMHVTVKKTQVIEEEHQKPHRA